jgi:uncharacterized protein YeaO (DUF488 family)
MIQIKRSYEPKDKKDGYRVLIDRLWPRGIKKSELPLDEWAKELAPSSELRQAFAHEAGNWREFQSKYRKELRAKAPREKIEALARRARRGTVTLVYSAKDEEHNNAVVLRQVLERKLGAGSPR